MHTEKIQLASDNYAGICPEAMKALIECNNGSARAYGDDDYTCRAKKIINDYFETECEIFFVFTGTAANSLSVSHLCEPYHSVICHRLAHLETDECGSPEFFSHGTKILTIAGDNGKVEPEGIEYMVKRRTDIHYQKPRVLSITQATEAGTIYTPEELDTLYDLTSSLGLKTHMDGARFANALASLDTSPAELTWKRGVDVLCLGGGKNGMAAGEAIVFFDIDTAHEFDYRCKQSGQLASKMRYLSAPWIAMLESNTWIENARRANYMAALLEDAIKNIPGVSIVYPREANALFVSLPEKVMASMRKRGWHFYTFIGTGHCRLMCSWNTKEEIIELFAEELGEEMGRHNNDNNG